jgi:hypothetical protein
LTRTKPDDRQRSANSRANGSARCRTSRATTKTKSSHADAATACQSIPNKAGCVSYRGSLSHCVKGGAFGVIKTPNDFWPLTGGSNSPSKSVVEVKPGVGSACTTGCGFGNSLKGSATL